jgi:hypothetical protein
MARATLLATQLLINAVTDSDSTGPLRRVVSMGRRNTKGKFQLLESERLKSLTSVESNGMLPWLGSD